MAQEGILPIILNTFHATEAVTQYAAVTINDSVQNGVKLPTAAKGAAIGIAQDDTTNSGDSVNVLMLGIAHVKAFEAISAGAQISVKNTVGEVYDPVINSGYTTGDYVLGRALEAATASGDIIAAYIDPYRIIV
jgi:hypothetical protein